MCDHSPTNVEATDGTDVPFANIISTVLNVYRDNSDHARKRIVDFFFHYFRLKMSTYKLSSKSSIVGTK